MYAYYKDHMGSDHGIADAARVSFDKLAENFTAEQNDGLIRFLARGMRTEDWTNLCYKLCGITDVVSAEKLINYVKRIPEHFVPFTHTAVTLRMSSPVPIRTQCFKHKIGLSESEESRRYISSRPVLFVPDEFRSIPDGSIKQGSGGVHPNNYNIRQAYIQRCEDMINFYEELLRQGVAPEQARFVLPQGVEVQWIWTGNLYAFANFFVKRTDSHAQGEIQDLAKAAGDIIAPLFPVSWEALTGGM